mgnify:CR=1 FL=1
MRAMLSTRPLARGISRVAMLTGMNCCRGFSFYNVRPRQSSATPASSRASPLPQVRCCSQIYGTTRSLWERACPRWRPHRRHKTSGFTAKKNPDQAVTGSGQRWVTVEEPLREGDQTFVKPAESSVPRPLFRKLAENDMFIAIAVIATNCPCRHLEPQPESSQDNVP